MQAFKQLLGVLAVLGSVGYLVDASGLKAEVDPENKLNDVMKNRKFLSEHPEFPTVTAQLIRANGFACQRVDIVWVKGESPFGTKFEVFCGPPGSAGIYESQHYAVYPERMRVTICKPNGFLSNGCD